MVNLLTVDQEKIIKSLVARLKIEYAKDATGHDWGHLERVWKMAIRLSRGEKVDQFIVEMAALLHDVDDFKFKKSGDSPTGIIDEILSVYKIETSIKKAIVKIAVNVSFKGAGVADNQPSLEGQIVQDADRLDAMGALGIARTFMYSGSVGRILYDPTEKPVRHNSFEDYKKILNTKTAINHFYEKLLLIYDRLHTEKAKAIGRQRQAFMKAYVSEFFRELKESSL